MKKKLFLAALVALTLIGCEEKQSEFILDGNVQKATITGKVSWPDAEGKMVAKDSVAVRVIVGNAEYSAGASGDKQFPAVVSDKDGFYTAEVPVGQAGISNVFIEVIPFIGKYVDPNSKVEQTVYYKSGRIPVVVAPARLTPGDVRNVDIAVKPELTFRDYTASVKISGKVTVEAGPQKTATGFEDAVIPYVGKVKVKGSYDVDGTGATDFDFEDIVITAEAKGAYAIEVPAGAKIATITLTTERFDGKHNKIVEGEIVEEAVYYNVAKKNITITKDDVEKRDQDFTVTAYDPAGTDQGKGYVIQKLETKVFTWGEVLDTDINEYKIAEVYKAFDVQVELSSSDYDYANPSSPINGNKLIFTTTAATKDGKVLLNNIEVYNEWEGYDINVKVSVIADKLTTFKHNWKQYSGFSTTAFKKRTWAQWHVDDDPSEDLREQFWLQCWPSKEASDNYQGYYKSASRSFVISATELKLYHEYKDAGSLAIQFIFRDKDVIKGLWIETKNDEDPENPGSYPKLKAPDDAQDSAGETWSDWGVWASSSIRQQDKYQISNAVANGLKDTSKFPN